MTSKPIVFIVDDDSERRESIQRLTESMAVCCRPYNSGFEFLDDYTTVKRGCVVCALRIADMSGLQIQQRLLDSGDVLPLIFVSKHASTPTVVRAMQKGAINFLESPWDEQDLWENIQHAIHVSELREQCQRKLLKWQEQFKLLNHNHRELLDLVMQGKHNRVIAEELGVSLRTVESRRRKIMDTLAVDSVVELCFAIARHEPRYCHLLNAPCFMHGTNNKPITSHGPDL